MNLSRLIVLRYSGYRLLCQCVHTGEYTTYVTALILFIHISQYLLWFSAFLLSFPYETQAATSDSRNPGHVQAV